jgi:hypothetical protein
MNSQDIERRLRLPAPDEPAILPALSLPSGSSAGFGAVRGRLRAGSAGHPIGLMSPRLAVALLALVVAMVAAIASGALRLDRSTTNGIFTGRGVQLTYPEGWVRLTAEDPLNMSGASVALILTTAGVTGCSAGELPPPTYGVAYPSAPASDAAPAPPQPDVRGDDRMLACVLDKPLAPGEIRLVLSQGIPQLVGIGPIESFDPADWGGLVPGESYSGAFFVPSEAQGWTRVIDRMPAKLVVTDGPNAIGADETRTWAVAQPAGLNAPWFIRAMLRGPDIDALRLQADTVAQSLRFDEIPPALDEARRDAALARAIDDVDRRYRQSFGSRLLGCFPRTAGEREVELEDGPEGRLPNPVLVTCRTTVEPTPVRLWHATLVVSWSTGSGYAAGDWRYEIYFQADGPPAAEWRSFEEVAFPETRGELPPPLTEPLIIPVGSIVELLPPGIDQGSAAYRSIHERPNAVIGENALGEGQAGRRFLVVDGPVGHEGTDWYLVDTARGMLLPSGLAWIPGAYGARPLLRVVEPSCPAGDVTVVDLLNLIPEERLRCFGNTEITLDPVMAALAPDDEVRGIQGTPAWLARDTRWRLFGAGGAEGLDGPLPVAIAPALGDTLPTNVWLSVRGHFDDAAASTCSRSFPDEWGLPDEPPSVQTMRCRHLFVVTSLERREAP